VDSSTSGPREHTLAEIRPFRRSDEASVIGLWERSNLLRPWNDPRKDIQRKLRVQPEMFLVGLRHGTLVATVMAGYEGHRGWINYLAVAPEHRLQGLGRAMMSAAERLLAAAGCPKINLQVRGSNKPAVDFYRSLGYRVDDVVALGKRLERDDTE
jgi:ribosomal protein S18 acetylase RimI-like enzyme